MISFQVWRALHTPFVAHPLYYMRGLDEPSDDGQRILEVMERNAQIAATLFLILTVAAIIHYGPSVLLFIILGIPIGLALLVVPLIIFATGTLYGVGAASVIALTISRERYQGRLDLLGATPYGLAGATWALGSIAVQKSSILRRMRALVQPMHFISVFVVGFTLILLALPAISDNSPDATAQQTWVDGFGLLMLLLFGIVDLLQSGNIGSLTGMIVGAGTTNTAYIQGRALVTFFIMHLVSYMVIVAVCVVVLPMLKFDSRALYYVVCLVSTYLIREGMTIMLWWSLTRTLEASYDELGAIAHIGIQRKRIFPKS